MQLKVSPKGTSAPAEDHAAAQNPALFGTMVGVAGALVHASVADPQQSIDVNVHQMQSNEIALVWLVGRWVVHASDLRAGTMTKFCEMVRSSRAKTAVAVPAAVEASRPAHVMCLMARDEGIPVGMIVHIVGRKPPLPMVELRMRHDIQEMWLVGAIFNVVARIGEDAFRTAIAASIRAREQSPDQETARTRTSEVLAHHQIVDDEAVACAVYPAWSAAGGDAEIQRWRSIVAF